MRADSGMNGKRPWTRLASAAALMLVCVAACSSGRAHEPNGAITFSSVGNGSIDFRVTAINPDGKEPMQFERGPEPRQAEHDDLFAALSAGETYNEGDYGATSTMTAIMGRMATYSGKVVTWEQAIGSQLDLSPKRYAWDAEPPVMPGPDGLYACAIPGVTQSL